MFIKCMMVSHLQGKAFISGQFVMASNLCPCVSVLPLYIKYHQIKSATMAA